jgi:hypothetical protein
MAEKKIRQKHDDISDSVKEVSIPFMMILIAIQILGLAFPYEPEFYLSGLFLFTLIPCLIVSIVTLIINRVWLFYSGLFLIIFRIFIIMSNGFSMSLILSIIGGLIVLLYINILTSNEELSRRFISVKTVMIKMLDFLLYAFVFLILALLIIVPIGRLNILESMGVNDLWIFIIGFFLMTILIMLIYILLTRRGLE